MLNAARGAKRPSEKNEEDTAKKPRGKAAKGKAKPKGTVGVTDETPKEEPPKDEIPKDETTKEETPAVPPKKTRVATDPSLLVNAWEEKDGVFFTSTVRCKLFQTLWGFYIFFKTDQVRSHDFSTIITSLSAGCHQSSYHHMLLHDRFYFGLCGPTIRSHCFVTVKY